MPDSKLQLRKPELTDHPVDVGLRSEAAILSHLVRVGYSVLLPFGVNQRYDLVLDVGGDFIRAQCKTGRLRNGVIIFNTQSVCTNKIRNRTCGYAGEADAFLVHCAATERVYCIPIEDAPASSMCLRVESSRNGQLQRINWAEEYELPA